MSSRLNRVVSNVWTGQFMIRLERADRRRRVFWWITTAFSHYMSRTVSIRLRRTGYICNLRMWMNFDCNAWKATGKNISFFEIACMSWSSCIDSLNITKSFTLSMWRREFWKLSFSIRLKSVKWFKVALTKIKQYKIFFGQNNWNV